VDLSTIEYGTRIVKKTEEGDKYPVYGGGGETFKANSTNRSNTYIISRFGMSPECVRFVSGDFFLNDSGMSLNSIDPNVVSPQYLNYYLFINQGIVYSCGRGVAQKNIDIEAFNEIPVPLPPIDIQEKVIDELINLEAIESKLKLEVTGLITKRNNVIYDSSGTMVRLKDLTSKIGSGSTPRGGESAYIEAGITLIRSQNVYDNEFYKEGLVFIDDDQAKKLNVVTVEENDILFNITGASVARCCIVNKEYLPARVNQHVAIIRTNEKALTKYVQQILVSSKYKNELLNLADNSSTREAITKAQLEDFKIPIISIQEQKRIVSQIEDIETEISKLEEEISFIPQKKELVLKKYL
jgi:type I restriction enzyme M protein